VVKGVLTRGERIQCHGRAKNFETNSFETHSSKSVASKSETKTSKLDSLKNFVFGGSSAASKKAGSSHQKDSAKAGQAKDGASKKSGTTVKASASKAGPAARSVKPAGKSLAKNASKNSVSAGNASASKNSSQAPSKKVKSKAGTPAGQVKKNTVASSAKGLGKIASPLTPGDSLTETVCREVACEGLATSGGYCRLHYIKNWKKVKRKEVILREKKLNQYIEELVLKYPDKYIEAIRQDLANDKDFAKVIHDLDLDEGVEDFDVESSSDSMDSLIDTIKRDFEDEGDVF
jgi:hypothetical protein